MLFQVCNLWHKSGVRYMRTCQTCPSIYPWTSRYHCHVVMMNVMLHDVHVSCTMPLFHASCTWGLRWCWNRNTVSHFICFFPGPGLQTARWTGCKLTFRETELKRLLQARNKPEGQNWRGNTREWKGKWCRETGGAGRCHIWTVCASLFFAWWHHFFAWWPILHNSNLLTHQSNWIGEKASANKFNQLFEIITCGLTKAWLLVHIPDMRGQQFVPPFLYSFSFPFSS